MSLFFRMDEMCRQQLYFLTIEPDDFSEITGKNKRDGRRSIGRNSALGSVASIEERDETESKGSNTSRHGSVHSNEAPSASRPPPSASAASVSKPFQFSDFASQPVGRAESPNVSEDSEIRAASEAVGDDLDGDDDAFHGGNDEEVFRVTTQAEMNTMMSEYRFRKRKRTLPSSSSKESPGISAATSGRKNPFLAKPPASAANSTSAAAAAADPEIADQQRASLMADSEAQVTVWNELVLVLLHLSGDLNDEQFKVRAT